MSVAPTVETYLADNGIPFEVVTHRPTEDSMHTAEAAHVSGEILAKAVVLKDETGCLVAVMPSTYKVKMGWVRELTGRSHLEMVPEDDLPRLFRDCALGAIPALADAYGLPAVWDKALADAGTVYFEGGDHESLVKVSGADFRTLMGDAPQGILGSHM